MSAARLRLWVTVASRAELDVARRLEVADAFVLADAAAPIYGRPGDQLIARFADGDLAPRGAGRGGSDAAAIAARLPMRAGVIVPPTAAGLRLVAEVRGRGRAPLAVIVNTRADAVSAIEAGATALVTPDAASARALSEGGQGAAAMVIVEVGSNDAAQEALVAGAAGLLVPAALLRRLLEVPSLTASLAPAAGPLRASPAATAPRPSRAPGLASRAGTIAAGLDRAARAFGGGEALVHVPSGRRWTWNTLRSDARIVGRALQAQGVTPGERVLLWARNVPEWPLVQLGLATAGAILVTANPAAADEELEFIAAQSGAAVVIAGPYPGPRAELLARLARGARGDGPRRVVTLPGSDVPDPAVLTWARFLDGAIRVPETQLDRAAGRTQADDVIAILSTSGTTGVPKGAQLTHRGMLLNAAAVGGNLRLGPADRLCLPVPFHHCFGAVMGTLAALTYGATLVLPSDGFDAAATLAAVASERCTIIYGVPTMFLAELERNGPGRDLSSLRAGIVAGAPVPADLAQRIAGELHVPGLVIAYGLTEASPVVTQTAPDDPADVRLGSIGRPIVGAEVRAIDPATGAAVPPGTPGELLTRGPMVMRGYFEMPDETNAVIDRQGWLHTGDLAVLDARGAWSIVGRLKDIIIRGGENIDPAEIEAVGRRHPGVADVQVVGVPSERFGEEVFAWLRPGPGSPPAEEEVRAHFAAHLARFKVPRHLGFVDSFPLTGSGKVRKDRLRQMAAESLSRGDPGSMGGRPGLATSLGSALGVPPLTLLAPKTPLLPGRPGSDLAPPVPGRREAVDVAASGRPDRSVAPGGISASQPPRPGWTRPAKAGWRWQPRQPIPIDSDEQEATVSLDDQRRRGTRIKTWGIGGNVRAQIESTGEEPIMYKALGTPAQTHHPFNLYGDIHSQPDALRGTFEHRGEMDAIARTLAGREFTGIIGLGSGTSQFVAQVANAAFARFAGIPGWDYDSQAFLRYPPPFDYSKMLAMPFSGSGSTVDTVAAARDCRSRGAYTLAYTSVEGSPVTQASDARILTAGGFDTGGSDTFHYTTRIAAAIYLALELGRLRTPGAHDYEALKRQLLDTPRLMADMFDAVDNRCRTIADMFLGARSIITVGAGANFGTAEEVALKFDEMAHIPTKAMNPGRHIHGALGLTEESILTVLVAPPGTAYKDLLDIARVTQLLKSPAVAFVSESDTEIADIVDYVVRIPMDDEVIFSVLAVLPGQLLPYWCGVGLGLNPDTQRSNVPKHARVWNMLFPPGTH